MAFIEGSSDGAMNGATPVTIVASPAAATRRLVKNINICNRDTAAVTLTINLVDGASTRKLLVITLAVGDQLIYDDVLILDATNKSITAVLSGAAATTNPDYVTSWADAT